MRDDSRNRLFNGGRTNRCKVMSGVADSCFIQAMPQKEH